MIELLPNFPDNVIALACKGHVTRRDYDTVLVPCVEKTLKGHKKVRLYYQIGSDFEGIDPGAVWEDFKVGVEHLLRWERIAVVTDVDWIKHTMRFFGFLMPGEFRIYPTTEASKARDWIVGA
jgi:SpoIIAA-like